MNVRGSILALDARTGRIKWKTFTVPKGTDGGAVWSTPAIDTATARLYVGCCVARKRAESRGPRPKPLGPAPAVPPE